MRIDNIVRTAIAAGRAMFRDMFDDALAKSMTGQFGLGIARQVMKGSAPEIVRQELSEMNAEARAKMTTTTISITNDSERGR